MCPNESSHLFTNLIAQMNHCTPPWMGFHQMNPCTINYPSPWDWHAKPWCDPHVGTPQYLSYFILRQDPWHICMPNLGVGATPSFISSMTSNKVSTPIYPKTLHPPSCQLIVVPNNIKKCDLQVVAWTSASVETKSSRNPKFHANRKPQILPK